MNTENELPLCVLHELEPIVKRVEDLETDQKRSGTPKQVKKYSQKELYKFAWRIIADLAAITMVHGHSPTLDDLKERCYKLMSL